METEINQDTQTIMVNRVLRYQFSDDEIKEMGEDLSDQVMNFSRLDLEKKEQNKIWNKELKEMMTEIKRTSKIIDDGWIETDTRCKVEFNNPRYGKKKITRTDTQESWIEDMEESEFNLFNQENSSYTPDEQDYLPFSEVSDEEGHEGLDNDENELPSWLREEE